MTPKEKANELINSFDVKYYYKFTGGKFPVSMHDSVIKQCALIAVSFARENQLNTDGYNKYLDEVKQEIEKL